MRAWKIVGGPSCTDESPARDASTLAVGPRNMKTATNIRERRRRRRARVTAPHTPAPGAPPSPSCVRSFPGRRRRFGLIIRWQVTSPSVPILDSLNVFPASRTLPLWMSSPPRDPPARAWKTPGWVRATGDHALLHRGHLRGDGSPGGLGEKATTERGKSECWNEGVETTRETGGSGARFVGRATRSSGEGAGDTRETRRGASRRGRSRRPRRVRRIIQNARGAWAVRRISWPRSAPMSTPSSMRNRIWALMAPSPSTGCTRLPFPRRR